MPARTKIYKLTLVVAIGVAQASANFSSVAAETPARTLRVGLPLMPSTLDPARADNGQAMMLMAGVYDTLYVLDPVARPAAIVPLAAAGLPEISADYRTLTIRLRPGIFFTPHPAFGGKLRELTAADFAYAFKRAMDPKLRSPNVYLVEGKIEGLDALAKRAQSAGSGLDYDAPVPGLVVVDRRTLRLHLNAPDPLFPFVLTSLLVAGIAREVVEAEGDAYGQRPVGTGAFVVAAFDPGQRLVFMRNSTYRMMHWKDLLSPASRATQPAHPMPGMQLPSADRIEFSNTPEASAEILALLQGELDLIYLSLPELATQRGELRPDLARAGMHLVREPQPVSLMIFFSMRDPVIGGETLEKVALRRAICMAFDDEEYIRVIDAGLSSVRHQVVPPGIDGYLRNYRNPNLFDPATANALLDRLGYKRGRDNYRRNPDGSTLLVSQLMGTTSAERKRAEFTKRMMDRIGIRVTFEAVTLSERIKRMNSCRFGMSVLDAALDLPDGTNMMTNFSSKAIGGVNWSCFSDPAFDTAYEKALVTPPSPSRTELFRTMQTRLDAMAPMRLLPVGDALFLKRGHVIGPFPTINDWLQVVTLGVETKAKRVPTR